MARFKAIDLQAQLASGSFEFALNYLNNHETLVELCSFVLQGKLYLPVRKKKLTEFVK